MMEINLGTFKNSRVSILKSRDSQALPSQSPLFQSFRPNEDPREQPSQQQLHPSPPKQTKAPAKAPPQAPHSSEYEEEEEESQKEEVQQFDDDGQQTAKVKTRAIGFAMLLVVVALILIQALSSSTRLAFFSNDVQPLLKAGDCLSALFTVIGLSLFLSYYGESTLTAILTTLIITSLSILLQPMLLHFFVALLNDGFRNPLNTAVAGTTTFYGNHDGNKVLANLYTLKLSLASAVSQLIVYVACIGRVQLYKVLLSNCFYQVVWSLNYALIAYFTIIASDNRLHDNYSIVQTYLFAGFAGLIVILDAPSRLIPRISKSTRNPTYSKVMTLLGTFFLWLTFALTSAPIGKQNSEEPTFQIDSDMRTLFYPEGSLGMFFALSSSLLATVAVSILVQKEPFMHLSHFIGSAISGGIMFGPVANLSNNLAAPILLGAAAGTLSTLYHIFLLPRVNRRQLKDSLGLLGPFFIVPIVSCYVTTPLALYTYSRNQVQLIQLGYRPLNDSVAGHFYIYSIISTFLGMVAGMTVSAVFRWLGGNEDHFADRLNFLEAVSLHEFRLDYSEHSTSLATPSASGSEKQEERGKGRRRRVLGQ